MSPEHFDFSHSRARFLHLGLPGAHAAMDAPWRERRQRLGRDAARGAPVRASPTNLELMSISRDKLAALARPCLPHLDMLIVNDFEIGARRRRRDARLRAARTPKAIARARRRGADRSAPMRLVVAHFPEGRDRGDARGRAVRAGLGGDAERRHRRRQRRGRRVRRRHALRPARRLADRRGPAARPRLRRRVDARGFDHRGGRAGRRVSGAGGKMGLAAGAGLTRGAPHGRRRSRRFVKQSRSPWRLIPTASSSCATARRAITRKTGCRASATFRSTAKGASRRARSGARCAPNSRSELARLDALGAFYASPLIRARQTMELARAAMGLAPERYQLSSTLMELTFGDWEGLTWPEVEARDSAGARAREADKWNFAPPRGESYAMLVERVRPWLAARDGRLLRRLARRRRPRVDVHPRRPPPPRRRRAPTSGRGGR